MSTYWPEGLPESLSYPDTDASALAYSSAVRFPDRTALVDGDDELTFAELHSRAHRFAHALHARGVGRGDVVALHLPNSLWFFVAYFGTLHSGAALSPINPLSPEPSVRSHLNGTGAAVVVTHPEHAATALAAAEGTAVRATVLVPPTAVAPAGADGPGRQALLDRGAVAWDRFVEGQPDTRPATGIAADDVAHLAFTGGTTGEPKGVRVLHRNLVANITQFTGWRAGHAVEADGTGVALRPFPSGVEGAVRIGSDTALVVAPLYHAQALVNTGFLMLCGVTVVLSGRFRPPEFLALVEHHRVSYITGSPTMWVALLDCPDLSTRDLSSLTCLSSGAAPIDPGTLERMREAFPSAIIVEGYGLTEATCVVTSLPALPSGKRKNGSAGIPVFDTEVEVRDGTGRALDPGEQGRLWVRGPQITDGYHGRPDATAEQFVDGWLDTGDLGFRDEDGFVHIRARAKDMLIHKGYNVYPRELEEILLEHPAVAAAAVVGRDNPVTGQDPVAFLVLHEGHTPPEKEVLDFVAARVVPYKKLRGVRVVEALPTSAAGKILKNELRAAAAATG
ncbi:AMP-binding protein [Nocardiopsis sp. HNM0947]|uniref:AMP-binding protein n=1 Tax=Nocardiopsis coralli TaxID=2772213 RepID=A0ABR9P365_9ACTN|nr:AMP-binding protein [Nocardiopsis coralli]MBE2998278.1 AMP-binding protein [Nocardiopsis coralli]